MSGGMFARRALRAFSPVVLVVALVTLAMAVAATAIPRSINGFLTDGLRYDAALASPTSRDIVSEGAGDFDLGAGDGRGMSKGASDIWGLFDEQLEALRGEQPQPLRDTMNRAQYRLVTAPERSIADEGPAYPGDLSLGYDPRFLSRVTMIEGEEPERSTAPIAAGETLEVVASRPVADSLGWKVGASRTLGLADRLSQVVVLTGIFEARDPDDPYWTHTTSTLRPSLDRKFSPPAVTATVFANAAGAEGLYEFPSPVVVHSSVWYPVDAASLDASTSAQLAQQARKFASAAQQPGSPQRTTMQFRSDLPEVLEAAEARSASSRAILATILAGPVGLAVAIEILVARLAASRLRTSLDLLRARGASTAQRRLLLLVPALAVAVVATAGGVALALLLPGGALGAAGTAAIVAVALAPPLLLVLFGAGPERAAEASTGSGRIRAVGEAVVALATIASVASVVQRGNTVVPSGATDLVAAAVPLLLSLSGCLITVRAYPGVLRRLVAAAHRSTGIAPFLGLARALRAGSAGLVPVVAVLVGVSVAVFSGVLSATLAAGAQSASEARVGADLSVSDVRLDPAEVDAIRDVAGVDVAAGVSKDLFHYITPDNVTRFPVTLVLVDPTEFVAVQRGNPGALDLPAGIEGSGGSPIPLAISAGVATVVDGETDATIDRYTDVTLIDSPLSSEIFNTSQKWVLGDIANADALDYPSPVVATLVLVRVIDGASVDTVARDIQKIVGADATITTPALVATERAANPAVGGIRSAVGFAMIGAIALSAAALALTTALDGRSRRRSLGLLATLGLGRRQSRQTVAWELAPLSVVGLVVGIVLGAALSAVVLATVDLRPFTAGIDQPAPAIDPLLTLAIVGGFALLLVAAGAAAAWHAVPRSASIAVDGQEPS